MKPAWAVWAIWAARRAARACWSGVGGTVSLSQPGSGVSRILEVLILYGCCGDCRLYRAVAAVVGVAAGGGVRPGRDRPGGPGRAGAGQEPAVGGGQAGRLRPRAGAGAGAGGAAAPVGGRAVHPVRAGAVRRG